MPERQRPFNGVEQDQLFTLLVMAETADDAVKGLSRRLEHVDRGAQKLKTASTYIQNTCRAIVKQLGADQQRSFAANAKMKRVRVVTAGVRPAGGMHLIENEDLRTICEAVWREKCQMCGLRGTDAQKCRVKKALDNAMMVTSGSNKECWYKPDGF